METYKITAVELAASMQILGRYPFAKLQLFPPWPDPFGRCSQLLPLREGNVICTTNPLLARPHYLGRRHGIRAHGTRYGGFGSFGIEALVGITRSKMLDLNKPTFGTSLPPLKADRGVRLFG